MTNPLPLRDPSGLVHSYACGHCRHPGGLASRGVIYTDADIAEMAEHARDLAALCCLCPRCGRVEYGCSHCSQCKACDAETKPERDAQKAQWRAEAEAEEATYQGTLDLAANREAAVQLEEMIRDISEDTYCAGWLTGIEHDLWKHIDGPAFKYGMGEVSERDLRRMKALAEMAGGWWKHRRFVPMAEWLKEAAQ